MRFVSCPIIVVALSKKVGAEDLSYKTLQTHYGRSVGDFTPSYFMKDIFSKAESARNENVEIPLTAALSNFASVVPAKRRSFQKGFILTIADIWYKGMYNQLVSGRSVFRAG